MLAGGGGAHAHLHIFSRQRQGDGGGAHAHLHIFSRQRQGGGPSATSGWRCGLMTDICSNGSMCACMCSVLFDWPSNVSRFFFSVLLRVCAYAPAGASAGSGRETQPPTTPFSTHTPPPHATHSSITHSLVPRAQGLRTTPRSLLAFGRGVDQRESWRQVLRKSTRCMSGPPCACAPALGAGSWGSTRPRLQGCGDGKGLLGAAHHRVAGPRRCTRASKQQAWGR